MILRPYQQKIITDLREAFKLQNSVCLQLPVGGGKTVIAGFIVKNMAERGLRSLFLCHRIELVHQAVRTFRSIGCDVGIIASGLDENPSALVQVASVQTLVRRLDKYQEPQMIISDEAHHVTAGTWTAIHNNFSKARSLGITASPVRLSGEGLDKIYKTLVQGPSVKQLISEGFLCPLKIFAPKNFLDLSKIKIVMGEYEKSKLEAEVMRPQVIGNVAHEYIKRAYGKRAIMFATSIKHSQALVTQLQAMNIKAIHLDADSDKPLRAGALEMLANGEVDVISNVGLFSEGLDIKAVECVINAAPTQSLVNWIQRCGRAMRPFPNKTHAVILDLAGDVFRHSLPDDDREWSLSGIPKRSKKAQNLEPVKVCEKCYAANPQGATHCSECGYVFPIQSRQIEEREGELSEITEVQKKAKQLARKREQAECKTLEDLIALGEARGYGNPSAWAHFVFSGRGSRYG